MDPATLLALLQFGGSMLSGAFGAAGTQQENIARQASQRRRAARLQDVANMFEQMNTMARLPAAYSRALTASTGAQRASAAMRGLGGSGVMADLESRMRGEAVGQMATQVNQAEQQRLMALAQIYGDESFGALQPHELPNAGGMIGLQGLLGGAAALAPLLGGAFGGEQQRATVPTPDPVTPPLTAGLTSTPQRTTNIGPSTSPPPLMGPPPLFRNPFLRGRTN